MQTAGDEIFLDHVIGQPQRVTEVRIAPCAQELIGKNRNMLLGMRIAHVQRRGGKVSTFPIT